MRGLLLLLRVGTNEPERAISCLNAAWGIARLNASTLRNLPCKLRARIVRAVRPMRQASAKKPEENPLACVVHQRWQE